ncbi:hypothetical protein ACFWIW_09755 [Amycolatopsis sp. NPDC058340]|uniref:hypothetical protein n=1 Tax=unclassified Amycolatopsis TaxID=2618356 RepID=UPI001F0B8311|nr:hypothetical protein [Amycolatopsis sp. EV170708-02-1]UMP06054.1 hypothetical protein MJQ72_15090 [Amycolatopsis sp. EV170708-02-1]
MLKKAMIGALVLGAAQLAVIAPAAATTDPSWYLGPSPLGPGEQIYAETRAGAGGCVPEGPVTSPGLAEPIGWTIGGNFGKYGGYGRVVKTPGKYVATLECTDGRKSTRTFTVTGVPPSSTTKPPKPTKTTPKPKPKPQVAVKPVGAPQTGGGAFAPMAWDW